MSRRKLLAEITAVPPGSCRTGGHTARL